MNLLWNPSEKRKTFFNKASELLQPKTTLWLRKANMSQITPMLNYSLFAALFLSLPVAFWLIMGMIIDQGAGGATHYVTGETFPFVVAPRSHLTESLSLAAFALLIGVFFRTAALFRGRIPGGDQGRTPGRHLYVPALLR